MHPVQPVRLCLPARDHPPVRAHCRRAGRRARADQGSRLQGRRRQGRLQVLHGHLSARLHGLRRLHARLPGRRADDAAAGGPGSAAARVRLHGLRCCREEGASGLHRQGKPVPSAHARVLRLLRRLRRDELCPPDHAAVRRSHDDLQRDWLLVHLGRPGCHQPVHRQQGRQGSRLGQLPVRG